MSSILALKGSEVHLYGAEWSSKEKKILRISCYVPPVGPPSSVRSRVRVPTAPWKSELTGRYYFVRLLKKNFNHSI